MASAAPRRRRSARAAGLFVAVGVPLAVCAASLALGAKPVPLGGVRHGLFHDTGVGDDVIVADVQLPRTPLGLLVGCALGLAGAVMQALTRNPLAEPGLLGVNAGASAAVVSAISFLGVTSLTGYVWFAFLGAAVASALVYVLGGSRGATPVRLALAGTAASAALYGYVNAVQLLDSAALDRLRFRTVGSLASADLPTVREVWPFIAAGVVLALLIARPLNALEMGDDTAYALGVRVEHTRVVLMASAVLLLAADWAGTSAFGGRHLPVGAVTGVLGGCYLLRLLVTERGAGRV
ncbi:FecCD family ABC transporter permease [Streptomyces sp. NBC_01429]|uniref:FecCD family ABC transporter permease n=1 Tax=Streptomyces sp. NBC_01429 TaxID=2903862 RepID=UPI002E2E502D|nr:iron chelate uptake ABC transporter family permease subunit [Streptomyces sp. NBC_01429]